MQRNTTTPHFNKKKPEEEKNPKNEKKLELSAIKGKKSVINDSAIKANGDSKN